MKLANIALAASLLVASSSALAADFRFNTAGISGTDYDTAAGLFAGNNDADSWTGSFDEFGFSQLRATSIYDFSDGDLLGDFVDTNIPSQLINYGIPAAGITGTALDGVSTVTLEHPIEDAQTDIDALSPLVPPTDSDNEGYLTSWYLDLDFFLEGTLKPSGPVYTGGYIDFMIVDRVNNTRTLGFRAEITGSSLTLGNLDLFMNITDIAQNFLYIDKSGNGNFVDIFDLVNAPGSDGFPLKLDTNVDPAFPAASQLLLVNDQQGPQAVRQANLDGSIAAAIPEPGTLAVLALGLLGLRAGSRRKKA